MYVYIQSEPSLFTVGFYDPSGKWHSDGDHEDREEAAKRVAWLNGSQDDDDDGVSPYQAAKIVDMERLYGYREWES